MADPRVLVPNLKNPRQGVFVNPLATDGATLGVNLFDSDGNVYTIQTLAAAIAATLSVPATTTTPATVASAASAPAVGGSNSGYNPAQSPAAAQTNYDLDASMINGLNNPDFPTLNYVLIGNGAAWIAKPMTGVVTIVASGKTTFTSKSWAVSGTLTGELQNRITAPNVALTTIASPSDGDVFEVTIEDTANTGCSIVANGTPAGVKIETVTTLNLDILPCAFRFKYNSASKVWFCTSYRLGNIT